MLILITHFILLNSLYDALFMRFFWQSQRNSLTLPQIYTQKNGNFSIFR